MSSAVTEAQLRALLDKQEIADLAVRYVLALDAHDWDALRNCFVAEPVFVHPGGRLEGFDAILARSRGALERLDSSHHLLGSVLVEVSGDTARCVSYFTGQHVRLGAPGGDLYTVAGSYTDRVVRLPDGWRIAERVQAYSWRDGNRAVVHG